MDNKPDMIIEDMTSNKNKVTNPKNIESNLTLKILNFLERGQESETEDIEPSKVFTKKHNNILERNNELRDLMVYSLLDANGTIPNDTKRIRLIKEIIKEQDESINTLTNTKLKSKELDNAGKFKEAALELILNMENNRIDNKIDTPLVFEEGLDKQETFVDGQHIKGIRPLRPETFGEDKDENPTYKQEGIEKE